MKTLYKLLLTSLFIFIIHSAFAQKGKVLMFVSYEDTYYSEYIVMKEALTASGYEVDVRSAKGDSVSIYMIPEGTTINETANTLAGSSYSDFTNQFSDLFQSNWSGTLNATPQYAEVQGILLDVQNMTEYKALVIVGGTGAQDYRVDGSYEVQGAGNREVTSSEVQSVAERLNELALDALANGKPVVGQCHGAGIPAYWRIPNTSGSGAETLGYSLLKGGQATGFPETQTPTNLTDLDIEHRVNDRVTVSSPHESFSGADVGKNKIITTRDWYPQTVAHAAKTLINILETFPTEEQFIEINNVLIIHGGAIDPNNCGPGNKQNDVPCNYGGGANLPADYTQLVSLLGGVSANDDFSFQVSDLDLSGSLPYSNDIASIQNYLSSYDAVVFFKHWSTFVNDNLQQAIVNYADDGGGVLALHHGLYNDIDNGQSKDILVTELFGAHSAQSNWSGSLTNYSLFNTNYGHFVTTYGIRFQDAAAQAPSQWSAVSNLAGTNTSFSYYPNFAIYDELYNNMAFVGGQTFGTGINDITPLLSNNQDPASQAHTAGFVKLFDRDLDGVVGKVACFEAGERVESLSLNHLYGQVIRNSVKWLTTDFEETPCEAQSYFQNQAVCDSYVFGGEELFNSGEYRDTLMSVSGCDSIIVLDLTIHESTVVSLNETACESYVFNGNELTASGNYEAQLTTQNGCDSLVQLQLEIVEIDTSVTNNGSSLLANDATADKYAWFGCEDTTYYQNTTDPSFAPFESGFYGVTVEKKGCFASSSCHEIVITNIENLDGKLSSVLVYPNPNDGVFYIDGVDVEFVKMWSLTGEEIPISAERKGDRLLVNFERQAKGVYFLSVHVLGENMIYKVFKR